MMDISRRAQYGRKPVPNVPSQGVDLNGPAFKSLEAQRKDWRLVDYYKNPGPIQYFGEMANITNLTLQENYKDYYELQKQIE
jgi:hypothetical protein